MPKTAVDEYAQSVLGEHQVRCSRQILPMQTIAKPHFMANRSHDHFRLCVLALDHRHDLGAMFWGNYVCTQRMRPSLSINSSFSVLPYSILAFCLPKLAHATSSR